MFSIKVNKFPSNNEGIIIIYTYLRWTVWTWFKETISKHMTVYKVDTNEGTQIIKMTNPLNLRLQSKYNLTNMNNSYKNNWLILIYSNCIRDDKPSFCQASDFSKQPNLGNLGSWQIWKRTRVPKHARDPSDQFVNNLNLESIHWKAWNGTSALLIQIIQTWNGKSAFYNSQKLIISIQNN